MNKKGLSISKTMQIAGGLTLGILGLIVATVGSISSQVALMRTGVAVTTFGVWMITWT